MTKRDAEMLTEWTQILWESSVWQVRLSLQYGFESGARPDELYSPEFLDDVSLEFHKPLPVPQKLLKNQRVGFLRINMGCGLRIQERGKVLVRSGDSGDKIRRVLPTMIGRRLANVNVTAPGGNTDFFFEDGRLLTCFPASSREGINWSITTASGDEMRLGPGICIGYESALR